MPVKIKSTLGSVTLAAENVSGDTTLTVPSGTDTVATTTQVNRMGGRKNLIINGGFAVSQRGDYSSATSITSGTYYLDRWYSDRDTITADLQHTSSYPNGYGNSLKITATSTGTGEINSYQKLEGTTVNIIKDKTVTLSAWVRSNTSSARLMVYSGAAWVSIPDATHTGGGDWELLTTTFTAPTSSIEGFRPYVAIRNADASGVSITSGDYIEFTQVQLELGDTATDFEHRSYGEELALCQRYYWRFAPNASHSVFAEGQCENSSRVYPTVTLPVPMRVTPSTSMSSIGHFRARGGTSYVTLTSGSLAGMSVSHLAGELNGGSAFSQTYGCARIATNTTSAWIAADAEL